MSQERRVGLPLVDTQRIVETVPNYRRFMTGHELFDSTSQLLDTYQDLVVDGILERKLLGWSAEGRPIDMLRIGTGEKKVMWVGAPHPNEPVGTLAIDFMSRYLCDPRNAGVLKAMDTTFIFIKCVDPDGLAKNEGWLTSEDTQAPMQRAIDYALNCYRPWSKDVSWNFPVQYESLDFINTLPESLAWQSSMDEAKPAFLYEMHNAGFSGAYFNMSEPLPEIYSQLHKLVRATGIPLRFGPPEYDFQPILAPAIFISPTVKAEYDDFFAKFGGDPKGKIRGGANAAEYLSDSVPGSFSLIPEVPYLSSRAFEDTALTEKPLQKVILTSAAEGRMRLATLQNFRDTLQSEIDGNTLSKVAAEHLQSLDEYLTGAQARIDSRVRYALGLNSDKKASVCEIFTAFEWSKFYETLRFSHVYHLACEVGNHQLAKNIKAEVTKNMEEINAASPLIAPSIQDLVSIQVAAGLEVMKHIH